MKYKKALPLLLLLGLCFRLSAQPGQFGFSRIDISQGLSHNQVNAVFKDQQGFLWFGTTGGLNRYDGYTFKIFKHDLRDSTSINDDFVTRILEGPGNKLWIYASNRFSIYDPVTEKFDRNPQNFLNSIHIPEANIADIKKDSKGNFWFLDSRAGGLYKYDPVTHGTIHLTHHGNDPASLYSDKIAAIAENPAGDWWIVYNNGVIDRMEAGSNKIVYRSYNLQKLNSGETEPYSFYVDAQNDLWIYIYGFASGVFYFNTAKEQIRYLHKDAGAFSLSNDLVNGILQDDNGFIWIATDHGGINLLDKKDFSIRYIRNKEDDDRSISQNSIYALYKDNAGIIWIGTFKRGISYYRNDIIKFPLYRRQWLQPHSLCYNDVNRFIEDEKGNLWIGTNGGGLLYFNRQTGAFKQYQHNPANPNSLCNDVVVSLYIDHQKKLWIGTYFGGMDCYDGKTFIHYRHSTTDTTSIGDDRVWDIMEDAQQRMWIGTFSAGLELFNREKNNFIHYKPGSPNSVQSRYVTEIVEDRNGNLWIATSLGIDVLEKKTGKFMHYSHDALNPGKSLSNDNIICIKEDNRGMIWIGTHEGLNVFDPQTKQFKTFRAEDGLADNTILNMLEDNSHNLWLSTPNGISNVIISYNKDTRNIACRFRNFDETDGLQGKEFNEKSALKMKSGEMIFGGGNGFNIFNPENIKEDSSKPAIVLTNLQVFNRDVAIGEKLNGQLILPAAISTVKEITLKYNQNVFSIEFAALGFRGDRKVKYAYLLENFNTEWLQADNKTRKATFTNLDPGNYIFKVKTSNATGGWNAESVALTIKILPPFWKTSLAYFIYFLLVLAALVLARHILLRRAKARFAIEQERQEAQRLHELDMMKIRFFTNVSHEFRTPLSLILSPMDKMIKSSTEPAQQKQFQLIHRNARRLLNMVNQLLDFRKMEVQELKLYDAPGDIVKFIKEISYSFTDLAEKKNIEFSYECNISHLFTRFDHDKLERILFNLLANAFKFTHENGKVSVEVSEAGREHERVLLQLKIKDNGIGIPSDKQEKIFDRFFQNEVPSSMVNQGSGIGLAITKEFVKLHLGSITVNSKVNEGSCFTIILPLMAIAPEATKKVPVTEAEVAHEIISPGREQKAEALVPASAENGTVPGKKPTVLLVEDSEDFRFYLKDNLQEYFTIVEAADGREGWQRTLAHHPDLVVSDISMPVMNGIDLCLKIKADKRTTLVPVILLTALAGDDQQLKGLETGANDYMTKPFNFDILLSKIRNLLAQQEKTKRTYQKQVMANPSEVHVESPDAQFIRKALELVEKNISNDEFSVKEMSRALYISRVALYKKLLALTGKTPIEFIRSIRLKRAAQLLEKSQQTVSEVAYEVGFNNPKYFSKYFKAEFDKLPSVYQAEKRNPDLKD